MGYVEQGIKHAAKIAMNSDCPSYKMGAVLMKCNKLIAQGRNYFKKSHTRSKTIYNGIHAEFNCLTGVDPDKCKNAVLFIARVTNNGALSMARPCAHCFELLKSRGIRVFYYTNYDGAIVKETVQ